MKSMKKITVSSKTRLERDGDGGVTLLDGSTFHHINIGLPSRRLRLVPHFPSGIVGSLRNGVFERRTSTGSDVFFILKHLDATKFVFLSVFTIIETICPKICVKPPSKNEKRPLPVDVSRSKTSLLKLTSGASETRARVKITALLSLRENEGLAKPGHLGQAL